MLARCGHCGEQVSCETSYTSRAPAPLEHSTPRVKPLGRQARHTWVLEKAASPPPSAPPRPIAFPTAKLGQGNKRGITTPKKGIGPEAGPPTTENKNPEQEKERAETQTGGTGPGQGSRGRQPRNKDNQRERERERKRKREIEREKQKKRKREREHTKLKRGPGKEQGPPTKEQ